ncbi:hypothetical protein O3M35_005054 [Rhynocoris fuscipes]|uniref:Peptidase S1 domain-containing protein n=1 Tax=Rhynocoris fuscipes TaxID=488301 RepID=A0AAW1DPE7_9HEMI
MIVVGITRSEYIEFRTFIDIREVPYVVAVLVNKRICTGFLVDVRWVVTAAHCLGQDNRHIRVLIGATKVNYPMDVIYPEGFVIHPLYNRETHKQYDIALIKLERKVKMTDYSQIITVDDKGYDINKKRCLIVGYGDHKTNMNRRIHRGWVTMGRKGNASSFIHENCPELKHVETYFDDFYWSYPDHNSQACNGDSGGPLVCDDIVVGMIHGGIKCNINDPNSCYSKKYDLFIILYERFMWLESYVECLPNCTPNYIRDYIPNYCQIATKPSTLYIVLFVLICLLF